MAIYLVLLATIFALIPLEFIKLPEKFEKPWKRIIQITLPILIMFIICVFKGVSVGNDTEAYLNKFEIAKTTSFLHIGKIEMEPLFSLLLQVFALCKMPFFVFLAFCYLIIFGALWLLMYKKCDYPMLAFIVYIGFSLFVFNISGLRQSLAMGVGIFGYLILDAKCFKKKFINYILYAVVVLIAFLIHNSAFILVAIPFLLYLKIEKKWLLVIVPAILFLLYVLAGYIFEFVFFYLVSGDTYAPGSFGGGFTVWFYLAILIMLVVLNESNKVSDFANDRLFKRNPKILEGEGRTSGEEIAKLSVLFLVGIFFQSFCRVNVNFPRFGFYFSIFLPVALSGIVAEQKNSIFRTILYVGICVIFLALYLKTYLLANALNTSNFVFGPII